MEQLQSGLTRHILTPTLLVYQERAQKRPAAVTDVSLSGSPGVKKIVLVFPDVFPSMCGGCVLVFTNDSSSLTDASLCFQMFLLI